MSNSATSAAKRRRAAPFLTASGLPTSFSPESSTPITSQQPVVSQSQQPTEGKLLTLPQVIALVDSRLTNLEKNVIEIKSAPITSDSQSNDTTSNINEESVKTIIDSIMFDHLSEFNERYEILANEILELKNLVIGLQAYTMNVNKVLFEERTNSLQSPQFTNASTNVDGLLDAEEPLLENAEETSASLVEPAKDEAQLILEEQPDVTIVAKSQKKKGSNKKSQYSLEQE
jgi:hypothetical protein